MREGMSRLQVVLRVIGAFLAVLSASGGIFVLSYFLLRWYHAESGSRWPEFANYVATWGLGSLLFLGMMSIFGLFVRPKQLALWNEIREAFVRMAKGDFNVKLDQEAKHQGQFGEFTKMINHLAEELKQMETLRQEFISNVSHEIRSPLTSIRGFASMLQREELNSEERKHYLSIIETESARLSKLSDNLLKLTSLESEHQPFEPHHYRLDQQLSRIVLSCEPQWLEKSLELELDLPEATIVADEELLSQVWINLIHNAVKFSLTGGSLKVLLDKTAETVTVKIVDTGIGIPLEDQVRIFERFYKGDKSRTRTPGSTGSGSGSGLGLAIVKKIVELHRGSITVESRPQAGSTFQVVLPVDVTSIDSGLAEKSNFS